MSEFLYLYRGGANRADRTPAENEASLKEWVTWLTDLGQKGHIKDPGQPLEDTGKVVSGKAKTITDGPYAEAKDLIGGYTIVEATDIEQAAQLAGGCPIFQIGGAVEIRPVIKM